MNARADLVHRVLRPRGRDALFARRHGRQLVYARARDHVTRLVSSELFDRSSAAARRPRHQHPASRRSALQLFTRCTEIQYTRIHY